MQKKVECIYWIRHLEMPKALVELLKQRVLVWSKRKLGQ